MTPSFLGQINKGKVTLDKRDRFHDYLHTLEGKRIELTVGKVTHPRSNQQNRYYWGVVVYEIAQHTGHEAEQVHEYLKLRFSPKWYFSPLDESLDERAVPTSTTRLDTASFVEYTEKCRMWANEFLGLQIPLPGEVTV